MFEIKCRELTQERRKEIARREVASINKLLRIILLAGGIYLLYLGLGLGSGLPSAFQPAKSMSLVFSIFALFFSIFSQRLAEHRYFSKTMKAGCFPEKVTAVKANALSERKLLVLNAHGEQEFSFSELSKIEDGGSYLKLTLPRGEVPGVYLFKEDFVVRSEEDSPDAFFWAINALRTQA